MISTARPAPDPHRSDRVNSLPRARFVAGWTRIVGEPPAAMLACRSDMIRILVQSVPVAGPDTGLPQGRADLRSKVDRALRLRIGSAGVADQFPF